MSSDIIDSHVHVMLPVEVQVEALKSAGVGRAVLFPTLVHPEKAANRDEFKFEIGILNSPRISRNGSLRVKERRSFRIGTRVSVTATSQAGRHS